jgi:hypothetical protein
MSREPTLKNRFFSNRTYLIAFWVAVAAIATGCNASVPEDALKALFGFVLLPIFGALIIGLGYWLARRSALLFGSFVGLFVATIVEITIPPSVQIALIGGILGISVDKIAAKASANLPVTIVDRLALLVSRLADSIKDATANADKPVYIRSVRRGVWAATLAILTVLLVGRAADQIGLTGTVILDHLLR